MVATILTAVSAALGGGALAAVITQFAKRRHTKAEVADKLSEAAERIVGLYGKQVEELQRKVERLERMVEEQSSRLSEQERELHTKDIKIMGLEHELKLIVTQQMGS